MLEATIIKVWPSAGTGGDMGSVAKKDLVLNIAEKLQANANEVQDVVQALFEEINCQLGRGNRIELRDFGVFSFKKRAARVGHNPRTLEKVQVEAKVVVTFKMGKKMRDVVRELSEASGSAEAASGAEPEASASPAGEHAQAPAGDSGAASAQEETGSQAPSGPPAGETSS